MLRKIATIPNLLAMLMVLFTTAVPHHHHHAMVCLVKEVCVLDGCCNDEHTMHCDTDPEGEDAHCVAHEEFFPSDDLRMDGLPVIVAPVACVPCPLAAAVPVCRNGYRDVRSFSPPPILTWRINC